MGIGWVLAAFLMALAKWLGAPVRLAASDCGLDLPLLMKALDRYVTNHAARNELSRRLLAPGNGRGKV
jgi:hypothetical protein